MYDFFCYFGIIYIDGGDTLVIGVLVELSSKNIDKMFDYLVPKHLEEFIKVGIRVEVPFGSQTLEGFVLEIKERLKAVFLISSKTSCGTD
mgnify:CR=1 FL=1